VSVSEPIRIAMWSGPRNISTAMMRAFGNRPDTFVCDEPFYGCYLDQTRLPHPGADEVIAHHETDWRKVVAFLLGPIPHGKRVFYQKHMAHHMLPDIGLDWLDAVTNWFLLREPREMITSLVHFIPKPTLADTGLPQQKMIFDLVVKRTGRTPPVIDAKDVLLDPPGMLRKLCDAIGLDFTDAMLAWPPGRRETDGVWAKYWYDAVEKTTGFGPYKRKDDPVPAESLGLLEECDAIYDELYRHRLTNEEE
jgi:Sulfotransferase domain